MVEGSEGTGGQGAGQGSPPPAAPQQPVPPVTQQFMPPQTPAKKRVPRGVWIAIAIGAIVIILLLAVGGVLIGVFVSVISEPAQVANNFMKYVDSGNSSAAWNLMSPAGKAAQSRAEFDKSISAVEGRIAKYFSRRISIENGQATVLMDVTYNSASVDRATWDFSLVKVSGVWKIIKVTFR